MMAKTKLTAVALASLAFLATSCSSEDALNFFGAKDKMTFKATQETPGVTSRTALASDGLTINWQADDKVGVYADQESTQNPAEYSVTVDASDNTAATLKGSSSTGSTKFTAVYPNSACPSDALSNFPETSVAGVTIPSTQTATAGTFAPTAAVMVATATTTDPVFNFKNVCAFLKFKADKEYTKVVLNSESQISGTVTVDLSNVGVTIKDTPGADDKVITLDGTIEKDKTYYICVVPGSKLSSIDFYTSDADYHEYTLTAATTSLMRNTVYDLGDLTPSLTASATSIDINQDVTITHKVGENTIDGGDATVVIKTYITDDWDNAPDATEDTDYTIANNNDGTYTFTPLVCGVFRITINGVHVDIIASGYAKTEEPGAGSNFTWK